MISHHIHQPKKSDNHVYSSNQRNLVIALLITAIVMIAEIIGGLLANSLALLSDAGHMLTDILALGLSLVAMRFAQKPPTPSKTFGFHRLEILAAFFNGMLLFFISFYIFYEAYHRLLHPEEIKGLFMLVVACIGLLANGMGIILLRKSAHTSLNVKSVFFHIVGDTISSGGVIVGGLLILYTGWYLIDPLIGIFIGILILKGAYALIMESIDIFLEATPKDINVEEMLDELRKIKGVKDVHHLHLWTITSGINAMSAHVLIDDLLISSSAYILKEIKSLLHNNYRIGHSTIQFESKSCGDDLLQNHVHR
ncbi:MAG: cobalt-zinc-cadmium efflux system protein [Desulfobacteraceae bacterium Eth-SRB2]|nr:MAG: cobalt-zinc-cadmium efflux system protein [Desulfobacteraceae bacterium Eth-SRB2]